ncbi:unnamed protein product [Linum trigynum]|uniref:Reverse transcriptase Ty1/copia-type domain-containing protein n=1 Tax=Linum trigynum TaxID=586398 RepID=A0AAV2DVC8_9ROSI
MLFSRPASYAHLRVFGCLVYAKDNRGGLHKFAERGRASVFLGYAATKKGYVLYDLATQKLFVSRDVVFHETHFPFHSPNPSEYHWIPSAVFDDSLMSHPTMAGEESDETAPVVDPPSSASQPCSSKPNGSSSPMLAPAEPPCSPPLHSSGCEEKSPKSISHSGPSNSKEKSPQSISPVTQPQVEEVLGRGRRQRHRPKYLDVYATDEEYEQLASNVRYPLSNYVSYGNATPSFRAFLAAVTNNEEPKTWQKAILDARWRAAMRKEVAALEATHTWVLVPLPPGRRLIDCRWVFKIKYLPDGTIERFIARLVAKGYTQVEGVDYHDTFAPVAKLVTVRCLIAVAVQRGWHLQQLDVDNAFLHGDLEEEVYMRVPPGFQQPRDSRVCRLQKSIYGLKQASRNWYHKFTTALCEVGFRPSPADHSLFVYRHGDSYVAALIYVDDVLLAGNDLDFINRVKVFLDKRFSIKDLGSLRYFLGLEVARSPSGVILSQRKYTLDILEEAGVQGARPSSFPVEQNHQLTRPSVSAPLVDGSSYRRLVGRLQYLTVTRPDITYGVNILSQFVNAPTQAHFDAAMRILRYLKSSPGQGLFLPAQGSLDLVAYCDADWGGCQTTRRSTTGFYISLGSAPVSWRTKKQKVVARSSAEAEYRAMASTVSEVIWLRWLLSELGVTQSGPTPLYCDNQAALHIAANPVFHERTKHVEMDCHFVRERVVSGDIAPRKISSEFQLADLFTKGLGTDRFRALLSKLNVRDLHRPACGGVLGQVDDPFSLAHTTKACMVMQPSTYPGGVRNTTVTLADLMKDINRHVRPVGRVT